MWDELAPRISELGYRVVAMDGRGHGDSGRLPHGMSFQAGVLDLGFLLVELGPPVGLIGHSMGGGQVLAAAGIWPEEIAWVINIDGLGPPDNYPVDSLVEAATTSVEYAEKTMQRGARPFASPADMARQRGAINTRLPQRWLEHMVAHGSTEHDGQYRWKWDPLFNVGLPTGFTPEQAVSEFRLVEAPVLVLTGGEDDMWSEMPMTEVQERLSRFGDVEHHEVAGAGHYLHLEQPEQTMALVSDFLDRREHRSR